MAKRWNLRQHWPYVLTAVIIAFLLGTLYMARVDRKSPVATEQGAAVPPVQRLSYVGQDGNIWLVGANGQNAKRLTDGGHCPRVEDWASRTNRFTPRTIGIDWSPDGRGVACIIQRLGLQPDPEIAQCCPEVILYGATIFDEQGHLRAHWETGENAVLHLTWSPDGNEVANLTSFDDVVQTRTFEVINLETTAIRTVHVGKSDLPWPPRGKPAPPRRRYDLVVGEGNSVILRDLENGTAQSIPGAVVRFPGHFPPPNHQATAPDASFLYWVDVAVLNDVSRASTRTTIYRVKPDGTELNVVAVLRDVINVYFSPDVTAAAFAVLGERDADTRVTLLDLRSGETRVVEEAGPLLFAWRPVSD